MSHIPTLIDGIIKELGEYEFEVPFRALLRSLGHISVFQKTYHGPGEHGKDIISLYQNKNRQVVFVFLIKTKYISTKRYRSEVRPELTPMIEVPFTNRVIKSDAEVRYIFVSTGDISRDALEEFEAFNNQNTKKGLPTVELWNRSNLVKLFFENLNSLSIFPSLEDDVARILLNIKSGKYNRLDWVSFMNKASSTREEQENYLPAFNLASILVSSQASLVKQDFISFDVLRISLIKMWEAIRQSEKASLVFFDQLHDEYVTTLEIFVEGIKQKLLEKEALFEESNGLVEVILYPIRTFSIIGIVAYLAYFWETKGVTDKGKYYTSLIKSIVKNNPSASTPPVDFCRKDIGIALAELCKNQERIFAEEWIRRLLDNLNQRFMKSGWWPIDSVKPKEIIEHTFGFAAPASPSSYLLPMLFRLCAIIKAEGIYNTYRISFKDFSLLEFLPFENLEISESEFFGGDLTHGKTVEKVFPSKFAEFCTQTSQIQMTKYSPIENNRPYLLQILSDVYLQHVFPEIYLDFKVS